MHRLQRAYNWYKSTGKALEKAGKAVHVPDFASNSWQTVICCCLVFSGNDRGSVIFLVALSCISFLFILQLWNNRKQKTFTEAFLIVIKQRFSSWVQGGSAGLRFTVYGCLGYWPVSGLSAWEWELFILHWKRDSGDCLCFCVPFFLRGYFISWSGTFFPDGLLVQEKGCDCQR